jgi:hypothetical protein
MGDRQVLTCSTCTDAEVAAMLLNTSKGRVTRIKAVAASRITSLSNEIAQLRVLVATPAARDLLAERQRQKLADGWTPEADETPVTCELMVDVAVSYLLRGLSHDEVLAEGDWGLEERDTSWVKPKLSREELIQAGTIILAEIERHDRQYRSTVSDDQRPKAAGGRA